MYQGSPRPWMIAIAGLMGAGKTTLARQIVRAFGWRYVPSPSPARDYVRDLFGQPSRWAFEAQTALFCSKALEICECFNRGYNIVVDRSLEEDAMIFAPHFRDEGYIDSRAFATYSSIVEDFAKRAGPPDLTILCDVRPDVAWRRIKERARGEENLYPSNHLEKLAPRYDEWSRNYQSAPMYRLDSGALDWRLPDVATAICGEIASLVNQLRPGAEQLQLFGDGNRLESVEFKPTLLRVANKTPNPRGADDVPRSAPALLGPFPISKTIYVAAPYTAIERPQSNTGKQVQLYDQKFKHGIPSGRYRSGLLAICRALRDCGLQAILPHRDVSGWGETLLKPEDIMEGCTKLVRKADVFLGILAESCGAHYEFGLALGMEKPCILISCDDFAQSVLADGALILSKMSRVQRERVLHLRVQRFEDIPSLIQTSSVKEFLGSL